MMSLYSYNAKKLNGPKPSPLVLNKASSMIKKPPLRRSQLSPVIVYLKSPTIIHVSPEEFMGLVQRLTGKEGPSNLPVSCSISSSSASLSSEKGSERIFCERVWRPRGVQ
ncbi:hypothetical protein NMG60_11008671 [Bertholletia excelsa]